MSDEIKEIPEHTHYHSLYVHCLNCKMFGINFPTPFAQKAQCGNCSSFETVKYFPACCIIADRTGHDCSKALDVDITDKLLYEASKKLGW